MSFTEKIDVLDLIINTLRELEEKLDAVADRLDKAVATAERQAMR
uniref:Uncharacterized protein n=1 Tax=viral metagenome TaxID=1070528 RepID=A0A6M3M204_9ZZZZ